MRLTRALVFVSCLVGSRAGAVYAPIPELEQGKAITVYLAMITMLVNLAVDVLYKVVDPRVTLK